MKFARLMSCVVAFAVLCVGSAFAADEPAPAAYPGIKADRPLTLTPFLNQAGLSVDLGLDKDRAADDIGLNLSYSIGLPKDIEAGVIINALSYGKDAQGTKFGGFDIYARWAFLPYLGLQLDIYAPGGVAPKKISYVDKFGDQLVGATVSLPVSYTIIENHLAVYGGLGVNAGFAKKAAGYSKDTQLGLGVDAGMTYNVMKELYFDLAFGYDAQLYPSEKALDGELKDRSALGMSISVGTTLVDDRLDLGLTFYTDNLLETSATKSFDQRGLLLSAAFRF